MFGVGEPLVTVAADEVKKETLCSIHHTGLLRETGRRCHSLGGPLLVASGSRVHEALHRQRRHTRPLNGVDDHLELPNHPLVHHHGLWMRAGMS